jgi:PAS domain S-box-containing protein
MISQEKELGLVRDVLKESPRGLTVSDVAEKLHMSRNSSAKYLEMLLIAGQVDMRTFGRSKIFTLSRRMPLATVLSLSSEMIVFIDEGLQVVEANEQFIKFADTPREKVIGQSIENTSLPLLLHRDILLNIRDALRGREFAREIGVSKGSAEYYFKVKIIPSVRDGRQIAAITFENITDRKRAELALKDSEARYRMLIENSPLGVFTCDMQGNMTSFNDKILELVDSKSPDFTRSVNLLNFEPLVQSGLTAGVYGRMVKGKSVVSEGSYTSYWGKTLFLRLHLEPLRDSTGAISGVLGIVEDITERKQAELAHKESEEKYRILIENTREIIYQMDLRGVLTFVNGNIVNLIGFQADEVIGKSIWDFLAPQCHDLVLKMRSRRIRNEDIPPYEVLFVCKDGSYKPFELLTALTTDGDGKMVGMQGVARDVTERKRAEEANSKLASIVKSSDDAIIGMTLDGIITSWNRGAERLYGYTSDEIIGHSIDIIVPADGSNDVRDILPRIRRGEHVEHFETVSVTKSDQRIDVSVTISPITNAAGNIVGSSTIIRDVTERKRTEEELMMYKYTVENAPEIIGLIGADGSFTEINSNCCDLLGYSRKKLQSMTVFDIWPELNMKAWTQWLKKNREEGSIRMETICYTRDGEQIRVDISASSFRIGGKESICIFGRKIC